MESRRLILIGPLILLFVTGVSAATEPFLLWKELVKEVLQQNPEVLAAQRRWQDACRRRTQKAAPIESTDDACLRNDLSLMHIEDKETNDAADQLRAVQLHVTARAKQAYYRLQHAYTEQELIRSQEDQLRNLLKIAEANYSAGKVQQQDVLRAQVEISLVETRSVELERDLRSIETEINVLLEKPLNSPVRRPPPGKEPHSLKFSIDVLEANAKGVAPVSQCSTGYPAKSGQADSQGGVSRCEGDPNFVLRAVNDEYLTAQNAAKLMDMYENAVLPQSHFAAQSALVSYEEGATDFLNVATSYATVFEASLYYSEQREKLSLALARLEEFTGMQLID